MMLYTSLDFHSCFPDKFHSGSLMFSRQQVLSIFSPTGNENVTTNDVTFSYPKATKMIQQSHRTNISYIFTQCTTREINKTL